MAKRGEPRPNPRTHLMQCLNNHQYKGDCFDLEFTKQIHTLRSDWFKLSWKRRTN